MQTEHRSKRLTVRRGSICNAVDRLTRVAAMRRGRNLIGKPATLCGRLETASRHHYDDAFSGVATCEAAKGFEMALRVHHQ